MLIEALQKQDIIQHDEALAVTLANNGELVQFETNAAIILQDDTDNAVYFILAGEANVFVNDRFVGSRLDGTCIGEMAAIDEATPRSATVRAKGQIVALKVTEAKFRDALDTHPKSYRALAKLIADRLRQRSQFYQPPNPQPVLFIGCSAESLSVANELQASFKHDPMEAISWTNGVFGPSGIAIDSLYHFADRADFAAFIVSADDVVTSRNEESSAPRDNIIFELGLFMGRLDRSRVFLIKEHSLDVKLPTDLLGITLVTYVVKNSGNLATALGPVCTELRKVITKLGVR